MDLYEKIEKLVRRNCVGAEGCFWTLHVIDNNSPSKLELLHPQSKNMDNGNIDESIQYLKECIELVSPVGKKYIVIALRSSKTDSKPLYLPFINPQYRRKSMSSASVGGMGMGMGNNAIMGMFLNQLTENTKLQIELERQRHRQAMRAMRRRIEESQAPKIEGVGDKIMTILEHPSIAPVLPALVGKFFGVQSAQIGDDGEEVTDDINQNDAAKMLENSVRDLQGSLGNINVFQFLKDLSEFAKKNPEQVAMIYKSMK